jgi:hypothetical protein
LLDSNPGFVTTFSGVAAGSALGVAELVAAGLGEAGFGETLGTL